MSRRIHITFTDEQYDWLTEESRQSSVSIAEYVRRAVDDKYPTGRHPLLPVTLRVARHRDAGRRAGVRF